LFPYPTLALSHTKFIGLKLKKIKNNYSNLDSKDTKTGLVNFLKNWALKDGKLDSKKVIIENYLTQTTKHKL